MKKALLALALVTFTAVSYGQCLITDLVALPFRVTGAAVNGLTQGLTCCTGYPYAVTYGGGGVVYQQPQTCSTDMTINGNSNKVQVTNNITTTQPAYQQTCQPVVVQPAYQPQVIYYQTAPVVVPTYNYGYYNPYYYRPYYYRYW